MSRFQTFCAPSANSFTEGYHMPAQGSTRHSGTVKPTHPALTTAPSLRMLAHEGDIVTGRPSFPLVSDGASNLKRSGVN